MGNVRTFTRGVLTALALTGPAAAGGLGELTMTFAHCTGRLSALMEHQWLIGADPEATEAERAAMITLLDAVTPPDAAQNALAARIEAKHAQARLLARAVFNDDPRDATWAADRAEEQIGACRALILS